MSQLFFSFKIFFAAITLFILSINPTAAQTPYSGTIFIDPDIITAADSSTLLSTTYTGQGLRMVYDRRIPGWTNINAYLFNVVWSDGLSAEAQVNPEFGSSAVAAIEANKYATAIGRLPRCLRLDVNAIWIHQGTQPFGGGNHSILIHTGQSALYEAQGILEETLVHEASHTSLDALHASTTNWVAAQNADNNFISTYAATNPSTEDIAESFLTWIAVRQCTNNISETNYQTISQTIPNRLAYFDSQSLDMSPLCLGTRLQLKVYLEGAYLPASQEMTTHLSSAELMPTQQPYAAVPFNYNGTETIDSNNPISNIATDWVLVEAYNASSQIVERQAAILTKYGSVVQVDGLINGVMFRQLQNGQTYRIGIRHRNHLPIITKNLLAINNYSLVGDFSNNSVEVAANTQKDLPNNVKAMCAGDANANGVINFNDGNILIDATNLGTNNQYHQADINLNATSNADDFSISISNFGRLSDPILRY
ncbi:MAG: hypothetical protein IT273_07960 [Chitinophagales bacterium]|nr:hypothetical protein [Chitinophagales bacterium]